MIYSNALNYLFFIFELFEQIEEMYGLQRWIYWFVKYNNVIIIPPGAGNDEKLRKQLSRVQFQDVADTEGDLVL